MPSNNYVPVSRTFQKIVDGNSVKYDILLIQFINSLKPVLHFSGAAKVAAVIGAPQIGRASTC